MTGLDDETTAIEALRHGAQDYIVKKTVYGGMLWRIIRYAFERSRLAGALQKSEEQYRTFVENAIEAICVVQDGVFRFVNPKATEISGYSNEELASLHLAHIIHPDDLGIVLEQHLRTLSGEQAPGAYFCRIFDKSDNTKWVQINSLLITWEGRPATLNFLSDITERKLAEGQVGKLASIGELVAGVAHEINNPLTSIMGYAQLLMDVQDVTPEIKKDLRTIYEESQRMTRIVQNLLRFARRYKAERNPVDINDLIQRTLELSSYQLKTSNIVVSTKFASDLPRIFADYNQIQQVILNIVTNAEQAVLGSKRKGKINITTRIVENKVQIRIADNGSGIAPENVGKIFDPFFTTKEAGSGTGLGLSVCHSIIAEHGGNLYVESSLGKGATFIIDLPAATEDQTAIEGEVVGRRGQRLSKQEVTGNILIVEDEKLTADLITRVLSERGHRSDAVPDGKAALNKLEQNSYDVCLLDLKMPEMGGIELYKVIKERYPKLAKRVVFATGDVITRETQEFLESTGRKYLTKPFDYRKLIEVIEEGLSKHN
jgi:two-component system NtrC family sensor kinase